MLQLFGFEREKQLNQLLLHSYVVVYYFQHTKEQ